MGVIMKLLYSAIFFSLTLSFSCACMEDEHHAPADQSDNESEWGPFDCPKLTASVIAGTGALCFSVPWVGVPLLIVEISYTSIVETNRLLKHLHSALDHLEHLDTITSRNISELKEQLEGILAQGQTTLEHLQTSIDSFGKIPDEAGKGLTDARKLLAEAHKIAKQVTDTMESLKHTLDQTPETLTAVHNTLSRFQRCLAHADSKIDALEEHIRKQARIPRKLKISLGSDEEDEGASAQEEEEEEEEVQESTAHKRGHRPPSEKTEKAPAQKRARHSKNK
jgi:chromosome segregation ATPase